MPAKHFPRPIIPDSALHHGKNRIGRRPHCQSLVRKDDFAVDSVAFVIGQPVFNRRARLAAHTVFTQHLEVEDTGAAIPFGDAPLLAVLVVGVGVFGQPRPVKAQLIVTAPVLEGFTISQNIWERVLVNVAQFLLKAGTVALVDTVSQYGNALAERTAKYIVSGDE